MKMLMLILALLVFAGGCTTTETTYNVTIHPDAFCVAKELTVEPGQGGDSTDSSGTEATTSGGTELSPGNTNLIKGFADQGIIFTFGASTVPTTTTETDATLDATVTPGG